MAINCIWHNRACAWAFKIGQIFGFLKLKLNRNFLFSPDKHCAYNIARELHITKYGSLYISTFCWQCNYNSFLMPANFINISFVCNCYLMAEKYCTQCNAHVIINLCMQSWIVGTHEIQRYRRRTFTRLVVIQLI